MLIIRNSENEIFLEKRPSSGLWGGLWSLPQIEADHSPEQSCQQKWQFRTEHSETLAAFRHTFSHFHLNIQPIILNLKTAPTVIAENNQHRWVKLSQLDQLGLSSPVKKILIQQHSN
jgi:A/G-specific adenine glycosylase